MPVSLHHINIRAPRPLLLQVRDFYARLLELEEGPRPPFRSSGFWLYAGTHPIVHLSIDESRPASASAPGSLDHVAFACEDILGFQNRLQQMECAYRQVTAPRMESDDPRLQQEQIFVHDPAGNLIELNFTLARTPA